MKKTLKDCPIHGQGDNGVRCYCQVGREVSDERDKGGMMETLKEKLRKARAKKARNMRKSISVERIEEIILNNSYDIGGCGIGVNSEDLAKAIKQAIEE